jgi:hypothetical protein
VDEIELVGGDHVGLGGANVDQRLDDRGDRDAVETSRRDAGPAVQPDARLLATHLRRHHVDVAPPFATHTPQLRAHVEAER